MQHCAGSKGNFHPYHSVGVQPMWGMLEGVVKPVLLVTSSPKQVLPCLCEVSWGDLHTTGFCKAVQPGLMLIPLLLLLALVMELAVVSVLVVSMGSRLVVLTWVCVSLTADLVMMVRMEGLVLVDGGL